MTTTHLGRPVVDSLARDAVTPRRLSRPLASVAAFLAFPSYPIILAATYLLSKLEPSWSPLQVVPRPLILIGLSLISLQLAMSLTFGRAIAGFFVGVLVLLLVEPLAALLMVLVTLGPLAWKSARIRCLVPADWSVVTRPMNVIAVGALAATIFGGITGGWLFIAPGAWSRPAAVPASADAPDIYLVLLDGYPRSDALLRDVGVDNGDFLAAMEGLGFDVAEASHSNYTRTALTLASMLNGRHIDTLMPNPPTEVGAQARALSGLINGASLLDRARASGYEIVNIPSAVSWLSVYTADRVLEPPVMNEFELTLGESGLISRVAPDTRHETFLAQHRMRTLWTFDTLRELPLESAKRPRLIFAHVLVPHPPLAFGPNGEPVVVPGCVWTLCDVPHPLTDEFRSAYGDQLHYLDGLVELTAERIIDDSQRPPIVIFFSDHGSRLVDSFDSMFDNLIVSYTPGRSGLIPSDATPVTLLPRLMNAYLQTDLSLVQDDSYWQPPGAFAPVMGPLAPAAESSR